MAEQPAQALVPQNRTLGGFWNPRDRPVTEPLLFQYSIDPPSGFSVVVAEDSSQPFPSYDRP